MNFAAKLNGFRDILGLNERFEREKKISLFELVVALVSSASVSGKKKTLADVYRYFVTLTGEAISRSSFWDRLKNQRLLDFIEKAVLNFNFNLQTKALKKLSWLAKFKEVFIYDSSPIRLPKALEDIFPGNRTNHSPACFKLSALYRLSVRSVQWMKLSAQKSHDNQVLPALEQLKGSLFLFDLGYFSHVFLYQLNEAHVWFVCRLKANSLPTITQVVRGVGKKFIGQSLDGSTSLSGPIVEVWANLKLSEKKSEKQFYEVRLIGFRFPKSKEYRWYVTNLPAAELRAEWIYPIYRVRWQIELFFKSIKSTLNADQVTSANKNIAMTVIYSTILASLIASSVLMEEALVLSEIEINAITAQRLMLVFSLLANSFAQCIIAKGTSHKQLLEKITTLLPQLMCPNRNRRPTSIAQAAMLSNGK